MKSLVLLSGGLDSTVALAKALEVTEKGGLHIVNFAYGQRHSIERRAAVEILEWYANHGPGNGTHFHEINIPPQLLSSETSGLTGDREIPDAKYSELTGTSPTYVPFRNGTLLSLATAKALQVGADLIYIGVHADDAAEWAYPDCSAEFIGSMGSAIFIGSGLKVRLVAPFVHMTKAEIVALGTELDAPLHLTYSCYRGGELHCGRCPTCYDRHAAFLQGTCDDPTEYEVEPDL